MKLKRPSNHAESEKWWDKQTCGPLFVYFKIDERDDDDVIVEWWICPDDEDKCDERAFAGSDRDIRGTKAQLDEMIDLAMKRARFAAVRIARNILEWAEDDRGEDDRGEAAKERFEQLLRFAGMSASTDEEKP